MEDQKSLNKEDLYILMESYKNNIQLNTTLLEQQKQMLVLHNEVIAKQQKICQLIDSLLDKLSEISKDMGENQLKVSMGLMNINNKISEECKELSKDHNDLKLDHSKLSKSIYVALIGTGVIIISLVGFIVNFLYKLDHISQILVKLI